MGMVCNTIEATKSYPLFEGQQQAEAVGSPNYLAYSLTWEEVQGYSVQIEAAVRNQWESACLHASNEEMRGEASLSHVSVAAMRVEVWEGAHLAEGAEVCENEVQGLWSETKASQAHVYGG